MINDTPARALATLRQLRYAALVEGSTLILLLGIAVPLKHLFDYPVAVSVVGPAHGFAFLMYCWLAISAASDENWKRAQLSRALISALVPFGGFFAAWHFWQRELVLRSQASPAEARAL